MKKFFASILLFAVITSYSQSNNVQLLSNYKPQVLGYNDVWGYVDSQGREYALLLGVDGTYIVNITTPTSPSLVKFIPGPASTWRDAKVWGTYAYVITEGTSAGKGLQIIDLSNLPTTATLANTIDTWFDRAHNIFIDNGFAYVIGTNSGGGMHILNLNNPTNPTRTAYYTTSGYIHDVYVLNDTVYAASEDTYDVVDVTNKANPFRVSASAALPGIYAHSGWLTEDKRYFVACEEFNVRDITVWDLQDRTNWNLVNESFQMPTTSYVHNLFIKGKYAHISYYGDGYVVLDLSNPATPKLAGWYDTNVGTSGYLGAWGCYPYLPSGNVLISDMQNGLFVFKFKGEDPAPFIFHTPKTVDTSFTPHEIKALIMENSALTHSLLYYRVVVNNIPGNWNSINYSSISNGEYKFVIPTQNHLSLVEYYFAAQDDSGKTSTLPAGGSGINPPGTTPPNQLFKFTVVRAGTPLITNFTPSGDTTIPKNGTVNFSVVAVDTTNLTLTVKWYLNSQVKVQGNTYQYKPSSFLPFPRQDTIVVQVANSYRSTSMQWFVNVLSVTDIDDATPKDFMLYQNFPNPFNPSTTISFHLPVETSVNLRILNALGEEVLTLIDNEWFNEGMHNVQFSSADHQLNSGVYYYIITAGDFVEQKKMIVLK